MYEELTEEQLAREVHRSIGLGLESALRAVRSEDPELGREWAIGLLQRDSRHAEVQARLTQHREALRSGALGA